MTRETSRFLPRSRRRRTVLLPTEGESIPVREGRESVVDSAVYVDGDRVDSPHGLPETYRSLREHEGGIAWIGLYRPTHEELRSVAQEFDLHELAVEDAIMAHQRPKLERYGDTLFVLLRAARYLDESESVELGEVHLFVGPDFVVTVRHSEAPDLSGVRARLESNPDLLRLGTEAILYAVMDRVVDDFSPVVQGLAQDIDEIETEVFGGDPAVSRRIYQLSREVIELQRAIAPLVRISDSLRRGFDKYATDEELQRYLRDVEDHVISAAEQVEGFRQLLRDILTVNATLVSQGQNEEMARLSEAGYQQSEEVKRISSWAAILFAPTVIASAYGMNFEHMPELGWRYGYAYALLLMLAVPVILYLVFKKRGWL